MLVNVLRSSENVNQIENLIEYNDRNIENEESCDDTYKSSAMVGHHKSISRFC